MAKSYFFMRDVDTSHLGKTILPDVYCPVGGYQDKNLDKMFTSKGEKFRYLRTHGMREAEQANPAKTLGGTEGRVRKRQGSPGNFRSAPLPSWMKAHLEQTTHVR